MIWHASFPEPRLIIMIPSYPTLVRRSTTAPALPITLSICYESRCETLKHYHHISNGDQSWKTYINYEIDTLYIIQSKIIPIYRCELPFGVENIKSVLIALGYASYKTFGGIDFSTTQLIDASLKFIQDSFPQLRDLSVWTAGRAKRGQTGMASNSVKFPWYLDYFGGRCCSASDLNVGSSNEVVKETRKRFGALKGAQAKQWEVELRFLGGRRVCRDVLLTVLQLFIVG